MKITWLGQSGYLLEDEKTTLCIDPYLSDSVYKAVGKKRLVLPLDISGVKTDAVFCTHNHLDHLDPDTLPKLNKNKTMFYAPNDCIKALGDLKINNAVSFNQGDKIKIGAFTVTAVYANHSVEAIGLLVEYYGQKLYFTGDTLYHEEDIPCDILFVCINGKLGNMDVFDAIRFTKRLSPKTAVPNHYGMFAENTENPEKFTSEIKNSFVMEYAKTYIIKEDVPCFL